MAAKKRKKHHAKRPSAKGGKGLAGLTKRKAGSRRKSLQYAVSRVHINRGGCDTHGRYWGVGAPLYLVESRDFGAYTYVRAPDAKAALSKGEPEIERKIAQERRLQEHYGS